MKTTNTFSPVNTKVNFIQEWTDSQFEQMNKAIFEHFKNKDVRTLHGNYYKSVRRINWNDVLGLAYTSSSMYAGYWICNTAVYFDADNIYKYNCFTIGIDGNFYAVLWDKNKNELCIPL
jgi:hypothetical protein